MKLRDEVLDFAKMLFVGLLVSVFLLFVAAIIGKCIGKCSYEDRNEEPSWGRGL